MRRDYPAVRLLENGQNLGFAAANNQGLKEARAPYALILNSDAEVLAGALEAMVGLLDARPRVGIVGPRTLNPDGTPQVSPIWYLWDGEEFLVYSLDSTRIRNLGGESRVSLNLDGNGRGGDIVIVEGTARVDTTAPSAAENATYLDKYKPVMDEHGWTPEWFAGRYSVPIRIAPTKYRYW